MKRHSEAVQIQKFIRQARKRTFAVRYRGDRRRRRMREIAKSLYRMG